MPKNVARVGPDLVGGTGAIVGPGASTIRVNDLPLSLVGDRVAAHGEPPHTSPTILTGPSGIVAENRKISVVNISTAECAHQVTTGSPNVVAN